MRIFLACITSCAPKNKRKEFLKENKPMYLLESFFSGEKIRIIKKINIPEVSVCEDEDRAYDYWKNNFNPNKDDCCNLRSVSNENSK